MHECRSVISQKNTFRVSVWRALFPLETLSAPRAINDCSVFRELMWTHVLSSEVLEARIKSFSAVLFLCSGDGYVT